MEELAQKGLAFQKSMDLQSVEYLYFLAFPALHGTNYDSSIFILLEIFASTELESRHLH